MSIPESICRLILAIFGWRLRADADVDRSFGECSDQGIPKVAIFTDGRQWHASQTHNRLADDSEKRKNPRDLDHVVLPITARDTQLHPPKKTLRAAAVASPIDLLMKS